MRNTSWLAAVAAMVTWATLATSQVLAAPIATFTFEPPPADATDAATYPNPITPSFGTGSGTAVHASASTDWTTPSGNGSTDSLSANTYAIGDYFQFSTSTVGSSDIGIIFDQTGSGTGPRDWKVQYSTNGTTFVDLPLASYSITNDNWAPGAANPVSTRSFDLTSIAALDNNPNAAFRLTVTSATSITGATVAAAGTGRVDNFQIVSDFVPVPEPSTFALGGLAAVGLLAVARRRSR